MLTDGHFTWNVESHVGPGCPNKSDDVQLVQFGYYCVAHLPSPPPNCTPADMAIFKAVVPGAPYSGSPSDPLTLAIKTHQRQRGGTQDGRVSPCTGASGSYGETTWMILALVGRMMDLYSQVYPRLDKCPGCPAALAAASKKTFAHT